MDAVKFGSEVTFIHVLLVLVASSDISHFLQPSFSHEQVTNGGVLKYLSPSGCVINCGNNIYNSIHINMKSKYYQVGVNFTKCVNALKIETKTGILTQFLFLNKKVYFIYSLCTPMLLWKIEKYNTLDWNKLKSY